MWRERRSTVLWVLSCCFPYRVFRSPIYSQTSVEMLFLQGRYEWYQPGSSYTKRSSAMHQTYWNSADLETQSHLIIESTVRVPSLLWIQTASFEPKIFTWQTVSLNFKEGTWIRFIYDSKEIIRIRERRVWRNVRAEGGISKQAKGNWKEASKRAILRNGRLISRWAW